MTHKTKFYFIILLVRFTWPGSYCLADIEVIFLTVTIHLHPIIYDPSAMDYYVLFRGIKRINLKEEYLTDVFSSSCWAQNLLSLTSKHWRTSIYCSGTVHLCMCHTSFTLHLFRSAQRILVMNVVHLGQCEHNNYTLGYAKIALSRTIWRGGIGMAAVELWGSSFVVWKFHSLRPTQLQCV